MKSRENVVRRKDWWGAEWKQREQVGSHGTGPTEMTVMWLRMVAVRGGSQNIVFLSAGECSLTKPLLCLAWDPTPGLTLHPHPKKAVRAALAPAFICLLDPQWPLLPAAQTVELGSQGGLFLQ